VRRTRRNRNRLARSDAHHGSSDLEQQLAFDDGRDLLALVLVSFEACARVAE
jgi:hypothetical protein